MTTDSATTGGKTHRAARALNRRTLLKSAAALGLAASAGPFVLRRAWAAGGKVTIFAWAGYVTDAMLKDFTDKTGIAASRTEYGTNDELLNQLKANQGSGFDLIWPTVDRVPNYVEFDLVQPLDEKKVNWDGAIASTVSGSESMGGVVGGKRYFVPSDWGTEALSFNTKEAPLKYGEAGFGDLWKDEYAGKVTVRGHSGLVGIGLALEAAGKLPHPMRDSFKDEATMTANYDVILAEAIANKKKIAQFWTNENEAQGAFRTNGVVIGQTWDSSAAALAKEGLPASRSATSRRRKARWRGWKGWRLPMVPRTSTTLMPSSTGT